MTDQDILARKQIETALKSFSSGNFSKNALSLFDALGYNTNRQNPFRKKTSAEFEENFGHVFTEKKFNKDKARFADWKLVDLLFQLSREELSAQDNLFATNKVRWEGEDKETVIETYLFFAIELSQTEYSRTALAQITREVNKVFPMSVMIVFKHGRSLTFSIINRRLHKKNDQKDVLEKVTLIKDISIDSPHRAHIEILYDLSLTELKRVHKFTNFVELHQAWQKTLDTKELNKRFYLELSNWYFWAMDHVTFPDDVEKNEALRNATSLIRLITRIIFIWFIKEKDLVPDALFDRGELQRILKAFDKNKKSDSYYRAILQNLFFGTLNQRMNERGFAREGSFQENRSNYGVKNLFRYAGDFAIDEKEALSLFKDIPFLNGGLFDCLDKENDEDKVIYSDGFSRNPKKQAVVPDFLFFGQDVDYDLNAIYGTRNKRYKVKGLFNILSAYKFTVAENTPVEEEIALDPELLGRVFENLLASYNPETQTTARKQTGSFYTPREIVNYMVDESLKAYLKQKLETEMKPEDADAGLEILFSYTEKEHAFTGRETKALIAAIDDCKILDPACGSGAFPMGVLHKFVHILHKLDPHNEKWQERQIAKARQIDDPASREQAIANIESSFANNELDYGRKLYLIENCIYGVDIQPIAVQIAKLRFFISLVVDQKKQPAETNLGILSLPNLETKFVAANTLIGLDKPQLGGQISLKNPEIDKLEDDLKALRHQYFNARTRKEKLTCQKKDKDLRKKISGLLIKDGWNSESAKQVAAFDPYDQNASSPFFDPEWMFGSTDGFDVVIGNPPYIQIQNFSGMQQQKDWERQAFKTYVKTGDVYCLFYELGYQFLRNSGVLIFITSNKWMRANYGKAMRKYFSVNGAILQLIDFGDSPIFENATTYTNIILWKRTQEKEKTQAWDLSKAYANNTTLDEILRQQGECAPLLNENSFVVVKCEQTVIKKRVEELGIPLKLWDITINYGVKTGLNEAFIIDGKKKDQLIAKDPKSADIIRPILRGRDIKRYKANFAGLWMIIAEFGSHMYLKEKFPAVFQHLLQYKEDLENRGQCRYTSSGKPNVNSKYPGQHHWLELDNNPKKDYIASFDNCKVLYAEIVYDSAFYYDIKSFYPEATTFIITGERLKFLAAMLNSKLLTYAFKKFYAGGDLRGDTFRYKKVFLELLPVPRLSPEAQRPFEILVDSILLCKELNMELESTLLESIINGLVYELYFPDEIKAADAEVLKHLTNTSTTLSAGLLELKDEWPDEKKLKVVENVYKELSDPKHPVSIAMAKQKTIPEVRIIEGLDK